MSRPLLNPESETALRNAQLAMLNGYNTTTSTLDRGAIVSRPDANVIDAPKFQFSTFRRSSCDRC